MPNFDEDVVIIGSGFGGSVSALRLAEKGYNVRVYEAGRRFEDHEFAQTSWNIRRYLWAPMFGCFGIQRIHKLPHVMVLAGAGVGGGSLNYANTLYRPNKEFFSDPHWPEGIDWRDELDDHYSTASSVLGVVNKVPFFGSIERIMKSTAEQLGVGETFRMAPVGVFFGKPGEKVPDPFFQGSGPERTGCTLCGNCMVGCRVGAKNTLMKNYLALAESRGVSIEPLRTVVEVREDPCGGYQVITERTGAWFCKDRRSVHAREVILSAGTWGTQKLLHRMKAHGVLPRLSESLGAYTRTNSEALDGATTASVPREGGLAQGVAITTSFYVDQNTHVENCIYGPGSNLMSFLATGITPGDKSLRDRLLFLFKALLKSPLKNIKLSSPRKWSERTIIALVMQSSDNSLTLFARRILGRTLLWSKQGHGNPNPSYLPQAHRAAKELAHQMEKETGVSAEARGSLSEVFGIPMTAHFLGGVILSSDQTQGVLDPYHRVWGYPGLHVVDGSAVPANPGVNPALTITALAERAMSYWPDKGAEDQRPSQDVLTSDS